MKKYFNYIVLLLISVLTVISLSGTVNAQQEGQYIQEKQYIIDDADLLSTSERANIQSVLKKISERRNFDIVIVTTNSMGGKSAQAYADDYFDYNGYGYGAERDGVLLAVSMGSRRWAVSTSGFGMQVFSDRELDEVEDDCIPLLSEGKYYKAFKEFAEMTDKFIDYEINGRPFAFGINIIISLAVGFTIAIIVVFVMKSKLKSVRFQGAANSYIKSNSLNISESRDMYLYSTVSRTPRPKETNNSNGSHRSSSGRSHGGRSGRF